MKRCSKCNTEKQEDQFNYKNKSKSILQSNCRSCQKIMKDLHYQKNKKRYYEKNKKRKQDYKKWFIEYKKDLRCVKCDENHPAVLDFHHQDPSKKDGGISAMIHFAHSKENILEEINKCIILCSNCHRKLHYEMKHVPIV